MEEKMNTKLMQEFFDPKPVVPTGDEPYPISDEVWNWLYETDKEGKYVRVQMALAIIRGHSKELKRQGFERHTEIAAEQIYRRCREVKIPKPPVRKAVQLSIPLSSCA